MSKYESMTMTPTNEFDPLKFAEEARREGDAMRRHNAKRLQEIIAQSDKEPFDYQTFASMYWRMDLLSGNLTGNESEAVREEYRSKYYRWYPEAKTIEEFAKALMKLDAQGGS
jgi:hypothetical protein